jgi:chemotaxis signal transduction protein
MLISHPPARDGRRPTEGHRQAQKQIPFMVVRFPTLNLAFDMAQLQQVIPMPVVEYSPTLMLGLAQVPAGTAENPSQRPVVVVDLHRKLYDNSLAAPAHLLLLSANDGLLYGIPVAMLPEITSIPADRLMPDAATSDAPTFGLTDQLVKLPGPMGEQILYVVDARRLVQEVRQMAHPGHSQNHI